MPRELWQVHLIIGNVSPLLEGMRHKFPNSTKYLISVQISNCPMFYC